MRSSRLSSFLACSSASFVIPALFVASRSSEFRPIFHRLRPAPSGYAALLAQNMLALLRRSDCWVCSPICLESLSTSIRCASNASTLSRSSLMSMVSSTSCFSGARNVDDARDEVGERRRRIQILDRRGHAEGTSEGARWPRAPELLTRTHACFDLGRHHLGDADLLDARDQEREAGKDTRRCGCAVRLA